MEFVLIIIQEIKKDLILWIFQYYWMYNVLFMKQIYALHLSINIPELQVCDKNGEQFASLIDKGVHFAVPPAWGTGARHSGPEPHGNQCQMHQEAQRWTTGWTGKIQIFC